MNSQEKKLLIDEFADPVLKQIHDAINANRSDDIYKIFSQLTKDAKLEIYSRLDDGNLKYITEVLDK